eukprot:scaffold91979_cov31-Tisochrysis_lutea.AAC.2
MRQYALVHRSGSRSPRSTWALRICSVGLTRQSMKSLHVVDVAAQNAERWHRPGTNATSSSTRSRPWRQCGSS